MKTSEIVGREVLDLNANKVGSVADIDITMPQGMVNYIIIKTGMLKKIPVSIDKFERFGDKVILKITKDELEKLQKVAK